jgi:hypothetical protein
MRSRPRRAANPQVELTAKQRNRCLVPVMLRMPAAAHLNSLVSCPDTNFPGQ